MGKDSDGIRQALARMARNKMILLMLAGAIGTYLRYMIGRWFNIQPWTHGFPLGTFVINVSGSFILGVAGAIILERLPPEYQDLYLLIGTGFCGGFTTFSTFEWETFKLVRDANWGYAFLNVFGSVVAGFLAVILGVMLVAMVFPRR